MQIKSTGLLRKEKTHNMTSLYFACNNGISGDMSVGALLDLGACQKKLEKALSSMKLDNEFSYKITKKSVNAIISTDFDVILNNYDEMHNKQHHHNEEHHHREHRNLEDVNKIIDKAETAENAKNLAKRIFQIVAEAEAKVHGKDIKDVHFHEVGAIDSIVDIVSFAVLFEDLNPEKVYFSALTEGTGKIECMHGKLNVPVPAVCEIAAKYELPIKLTDNEGEMVTPTGAAIAAALYTGEKLPSEIIMKKVGYGSGKRPYDNPVLRVMKIK